ncbi:Homeobox domain-containing protein [Cephalotus follicularis]|uniref:Homeobox domain-containing protein n=1 Tax=Cephalotus follicularis TaxID=3775 RepID=A0A1Q3DAN4_CEPFO|nr:Homeobox domain-containing protein [Cephalotus follicularis]
MGFVGLSFNNSICIFSSIFTCTQSPRYTTNLFLPRHHLCLSPLAFSRHRRRNRNTAVTSKENKKVADDDDDPFEALFSQLEEDLKNDDASNDDDDEITEEDIDMLAREFDQALGDVDDAEILTDDDDDDDDKEEEETPPVKLKNWQLRRLAHALKVGRRKTRIKNLAAELCLDRGIVLELLRNPSPSLVLMSAALPDEPKPAALVPESETQLTEADSVEKTAEYVAEPKHKVKEPIHLMQHRWSARKRLKKMQVQTLESVYKRSKRPTNTMISSIVHLTNLPRLRVIKWFEDKRAVDGVPDNHRPYQRSVPDIVLL